ncbi:MAG: hypothetical protein Q7W56_01740 [Candidatus Latescibacteria bacterium]|nr:hypothetical protein [Candidatus Latescibacterota bacterium]
MRLIRSILLILLATAVASPVAALDNVLFLHHSTGRNLIDEGGMRGTIAQLNQGRGVPVQFWDHDYNAIGLRNPAGNYTGVSYGIPGDNTDPDGLHALWTTANSARTQILQNHQVIAFKSCYPASDVGSDAELAQYKAWYLAMRDVFDEHPDKIFVVISQPPRHRLNTDRDDAARARAFAVWLGSADFLAGHHNVRFFDLFDRLAKPNDGSATANMLRWEYERSHSSDDSHPNAAANLAVGPVFAAFLIEVAGSVTPNTDSSWGEVKAAWR